MHRARSVFTVLLAVSLLAPAVARAQTATTGSFAQDAKSNLPISATTDFLLPFSGAGKNPDPLNTAEHELLHAIGFTVAYTLFSAKVADLNDGTDRRKFTINATTSAILVPADDGTHLDPNVAGQNEIMQPSQVAGQYVTQLDADILNTAFDWSNVNGGGLNITPTYVGTWTNDDKSLITDAISAVSGKFGPNTRNSFDWTVEMKGAPPAGAEEDPVPEGSTFLGFGCFVVLGCIGLRRRTASSEEAAVGGAVTVSGVPRAAASR